jgi:hypothetical protein
MSMNELGLRINSVEGREPSAGLGRYGKAPSAATASEPAPELSDAGMNGALDAGAEMLKYQRG